MLREEDRLECEIGKLREKLEKLRLYHKIATMGTETYKSLMPTGPRSGDYIELLVLAAYRERFSEMNVELVTKPYYEKLPDYGTWMAMKETEFDAIVKETKQGTDGEYEYYPLEVKSVYLPRKTVDDKQYSECDITTMEELVKHKDSAKELLREENGSLKPKEKDAYKQLQKQIAVTKAKKGILVVAFMTIDRRLVMRRFSIAKDDGCIKVQFRAT